MMRLGCVAVLIVMWIAGGAIYFLMNKSSRSSQAEYYYQETLRRQRESQERAERERMRAEEMARIATAPTVARPEVPSESDITSAQERVRSSVVACAVGRHGSISLSVTFSSGGYVTAATSQRSSFRPAATRCMESAVRRAIVPPFTRDSSEATFSFEIQ